MGATYVNVTVTNPAEPGLAWEGEFLVDTGALHSAVPRRRLEAIGLQPADTRKFELADGSVVDMDTGGACLDFMGRTAHATMVFGADSAEPPLGAIALEDAGMAVDPVDQSLKPVRHFLYHRRPLD